MLHSGDPPSLDMTVGNELVPLPSPIEKRLTVQNPDYWSARPRSPFTPVFQAQGQKLHTSMVHLASSFVSSQEPLGDEISARDENAIGNRGARPSASTPRSTEPQTPFKWRELLSRPHRRLPPRRLLCFLFSLSLLRKRGYVLQVSWALVAASLSMLVGRAWRVRTGERGGRGNDSLLTLAAARSVYESGD